MCADPKLLLLVRTLQGKVATKPKLSVVYAASDRKKAKTVLTSITTSSYKPEIINVREIAAEIEEP